MRRLLHAKIHRATITHADIHYEGSITIPPMLLKASNIAEFEAVSIWNVTNGNRFETYTIEGRDPRSSDETAAICVNGAAARLVTPGDIIIIASFAYLDRSEIANHAPTVVFVDERNALVRQGREQPFTACA
jgi:aspartate 1-decarboxylase